MIFSTLILFLYFLFNGRGGGLLSLPLESLYNKVSYLLLFSRVGWGISLHLIGWFLRDYSSGKTVSYRIASSVVLTVVQLLNRR